jgi:UDP-N-acetylmuramoylalanine--D-glutamate ligase
LKAGGAEVIASDDTPEKLAEAAKEGFITADLRTVSWENFAALVLTPGVPLTHPKPHWTVDAAKAAGVEVIGDIELFCRERKLHAPDAPFVAITGTNGKSTTTALIAHLMREAGYDTQMGGNIGTAILSLAPPAKGRVHVIEMSSYQIDLTPSLDPAVGILLNVTEDHIDRHGTIEHYAAVKERLVAGVQQTGTAIVGVDDAFCAEIADRVAQAGKNVVRVSVKRPVADGVCLEGETIVRVDGGARTRIASVADIGSLRGLHNAQNAACASAPKFCRRGCEVSPASRIAWSRSAARAMCCSSTTPRAPMRMRRRVRCRRSGKFSGLRAESPRPAVSSRCASSFRVSARLT